jgi:hypothetical protein
VLDPTGATVTVTTPAFTPETWILLMQSFSAASGRASISVNGAASLAATDAPDVAAITTTVNASVEVTEAPDVAAFEAAGEVEVVLEASESSDVAAAVVISDANFVRPPPLTALYYPPERLRMRASESSDVARFEMMDFRVTRAGIARRRRDELAAEACCV